ncbi:hypothetical protein CJA_0351 [Cellvibrio japonicus Ueda107]|uniref:Uncharacterized protein n=1 Tax=Cellvibrio japonicus (strain Ueda107) TaxID=498211 RepID=B3PI12_CELJU|nr:hypothetical protein CJA_0351 [Cellvibrio japonicus Ueda107]
MQIDNVVLWGVLLPEPVGIPVNPLGLQAVARQDKNN